MVPRNDLNDSNTANRLHLLTGDRLQASLLKPEVVPKPKHLTLLLIVIYTPTTACIMGTLQDFSIP